MIIVKNRKMVVPYDDMYIGTTYDDDSERRIFRIDRYAQNERDLSALTFRLDIKQPGQQADTVILDKDIDERYIYLIWNITNSVIRAVGLMFVQIRAIDNEATVKWSTYDAALYVARHLNTPGSYTGSLTEIEQMEQDFEYMKSVVEELKANLDYAHDAEAWAKGTRSGSAVPSTDDTYHNNSKYYSEQANASKTAAANSATAAAGSATQAAETVADTNTRFNNAVAAVTVNTEVQDARVGADGTTYTVLKNRLDAEHTDVKSAFETEAFRATKVTAVNDFDNYMTNGAYLVNSGSLLNRPDTTEQGTLLVFAYNTTGNYGYAQIYVTNSSYRMFYRVYVRGTWKSWVEISSTTMLSDATDKAFMERAIATSDFNNYTKNGAYLVNSNMTNAPYTSANGLLCVMTWNNSNAYGMMQMFIPNNASVLPYYRYRWNSAWSAWSEFSNDLGLDVIHIPSGNNVLDPENFTLAGYISTQDGTTFTSNQNYMCTNDYIDVPFGSTDIYAVFPQTENNDRVCCFLFYDSLNNYVGSYSGRLSGQTYYKRYEVSGRLDVAKIKFWVNKTSVSGGSNDVCISFATVTAYEQYTEIGGVRNASLETPSIYMPFAGKTIVNFGDSIFGNKRDPWSVSYALEKNTGAKVYNMGFGGTDMAARSSATWDAFSMYRLAYAIANNDFSLQDTAIEDTTAGLLSYFPSTLSLLKSIDFNDVDIITIAFGTNDFTGNIVLDNESDPDDTTKFCGALRYSLDRIMAAFPHIKIFVCGQTYRFWMDSSNVFVDDSDTHENGNGDKLTDFVASTKSVSDEYHVPFIDNYNIGINKINRSYYFPANDGTHQNYHGAKLIADHIKHEIF